MPDDDIRDALPETEPYPAPIFDTGPHSEPLAGFSATAWSLSAADAERTDSGSSVAVAEPGNPDTPSSGADSLPSQPLSKPLVVPAASVVVPGQYHFLKWWKLVLVLVAVWIPAAGVGLGLFYWWYQSFDKTPAVFVVLIYVVVCTVAGLMMAMVQDNPLVSALAIAVMSAVFASAVAAAPLYGHYYCQQVKSPCVAGIVPY
ncbi:MAG: hypothetical protein ACRDTN_09965 [Mycobacterium sp.]